MNDRRQPVRRGDVSLTLYGVTVNDTHTSEIHLPDVTLVSLRDLTAICAPTEYRAVEADDAAVERVNEVVSAFALGSPVLPAPIGIVFRSEESVQRWLELHYSALSGALSFVENRVAARVHVYRAAEPGDESDAATDLPAVAAESIRVLRRAAVATLPLRSEKQKGIVLSAAFLVEDELWKNFVEEVEAQGKTESAVRFEVTGPWPPYDFVQMQLGA
jgi:hypothetical protein